MAGWDVTVLSAALSLVVGVVWAAAKLALTGWKSAAKESIGAEEILETQSEFGLVSLRGND